MVAVRDMGRISAAFLSGPRRRPGVQRARRRRAHGSQIALAGSCGRAGLPARYEVLPLQVLGDNADARAVGRWFAETPASYRPTSER